MTGLTSALMDSIPVVALTGQVPAPMIGKDGFQEADTIGISLPCTKMSFMVRAAADIPGIIQRAFKAAVSGRPGPVHTLVQDIPGHFLVFWTVAALRTSSYFVSTGIRAKN
jgi:acetolactate synthase I/II/III large subunit